MFDLQLKNCKRMFRSKITVELLWKKKSMFGLKHAPKESFGKGIEVNERTETLLLNLMHLEFSYNSSSRA